MGNTCSRTKGLPRIPHENKPLGAKQEHIKAHYVMHILRSIEGELIDTTHPNFGLVQYIGLHDIVSPESMNCIKQNGQVIYGGQVFQKKVDARYCPLCTYSSQNHQMLNNHVHVCQGITRIHRSLSRLRPSHKADSCSH